MTSFDAYIYAYYNYTKPGFNLVCYQKICCKEPYYAYRFAHDIPGADIEYCQRHIRKNLTCMLWFVRDVPGADIAYARKSCGSNEYWLTEFNNMLL